MPRLGTSVGRVLVGLLVVSFSMIIRGQPDVCQDGTGPGGTGSLCDCSQPPGSALSVDCTARALSVIPVIPVNTGVLDLTNNNIVLIQIADFHSLDTLERLILTGNPLICDCSLIDFKNWLINLMSVATSEVTVEGAVCSDDTHENRGVLDAPFCIGSYQCVQCQGSANDACTLVAPAGTSCFPDNACQNEVNYAADGELSITKSCAGRTNCEAAALAVNEAECRQADGAPSRCIYCCQGDDCNQELNTIDDEYVFPFRKPLPVTTEALSTADLLTTEYQAPTTVASTPEITTEFLTEPAASKTQTSEPSTTEAATTMATTESPPTDGGPQASQSLSVTGNSLTDTTSRTVNPFITTVTPRSTAALLSTPESTRTDGGLRTSTVLSKTPQTEVTSRTPEALSTVKTAHTDSRTRAPQTSQPPSRPRTDDGAIRTPQNVVSQTTIRETTSSITESPSLTCPSEMTQGEEGVLNWPATGVNRTAEMLCPYGVPGSQEGARYARRTCTWDAKNNRAVWAEPRVDDCSSATGVLLELAQISITEENVLEVSAQLKLLVSYTEPLQAGDVTSAVEVLSRLLDTLRKYPEKSQEIFQDAMATADQMTTVRFGELVESQKANRTTSRLLELIDEFALQISFLNSSKVTSESRSIDVIILDLEGRPIDDLLFGGSKAAYEDDAKPFVDLNGTAPENVTGSVHLPASLLHQLHGQLSRSQFVLYQDTTYFEVIASSVGKPFADLKPPAAGTTTELNSAVVSASIGNLSIADLEEPILILLKKSETMAKNPQCAFWDTNANDQQGGWSTRGCFENKKLSDPTTVACECTHLTNFAMLMDVYDIGLPDPVHSKILAIVSYVGCSLSIVALMLAIITFGCCREESRYRATGSGSLNTGAAGKARADRHTNILVHLSLGLILADVSFLLNTVTVELQLGDQMCLAMAVLTHYCLLTAMAWMALEAFNMYLALVLVFDKYYSRFMLKMCLFGWGAPLVIVATTFSINFPDNYGLFNGICWLARVPFLASFLTPVCVVLLFNVIVFLAVTWQLCKMRRRNISQSRRSFDLAAQFKASASITFLFGLTWSFAIFGIGEANLAFSYLFAIFNSAQGFNIFVFQCLLKPSIRKRWMKALRRQQEEMFTSSNGKSSGSKDSNNLEIFKTSGTNQSNGKTTGQL